VVAAEGADTARIEREIVTMPNYFADYDTTVHFISQDELDRDHKGIPHGGKVFRCGKTGLDANTPHVMEFSLNLASNPEFTSSVLVAYARAAYRLSMEGATGCRTVLDIPPAYLHPADASTLRKTLL
jgi:diaminopimelate dehydrogenase